jgi:hypothetical protein
MNLAVSSDPAVVAMRDRLALVEMQLHETTRALALSRVALLQSDNARDSAVKLLAINDTCMCDRCAALRAQPYGE